MKGVVIRDEKSFSEKLAVLKSGGFGNLHIISDFDRTLTLDSYQGRTYSLSYHPLYECFKTDEQKQMTKELYERYHPYEMMPGVSEEERSGKLSEWWTKFFEFTVRCKIHSKDLAAEIDKAGLPFRGGVRKFFSIARNKQVPVLIFSAGIDNVISACLGKFGVLFPNVHVIANHLTIDDEGFLSGFRTPLVLVFSKDERHVKHTNYKGEIESRRNVILIGDSLNDLTMTKGLAHDCVLKIGFLNNNIDESIKNYSEAFDVVITHDGSFDFVNKILEDIS